MAPAVGFLGGLGLFLVWWACWKPAKVSGRANRTRRLDQLLRRAGITGVTPFRLIGGSVVLGLFVATLVAALTGAWPVAACFGGFASGAPLAVVNWLAKRRTRALREVWPDAVDHLRSAI